MPKPKIIDTADTMTSSKLSALKKAGVETIIRYDDRRPRGGWKQIHPAEAELIRDAGLRLGIVYEDAATASYFTRLEGILSATYARQQAAKRGQPEGSAEYFAVDFDPTSADTRNRIIPYFDGVYQAFDEQNGLPRLYVGAYCSGLCATMLKAKYPNILIWITCSLGFNGSRDYVRAGRHDLFQGTTSPLKGACDKKFLGVDCDFDEPNNPNWGWFVPWGNFTPEPTLPPPLPVSHDIKWLQGILQNPLYGYHGDIDGIVGARTHTHLEKKPRTVMSRSCVISFPFDRRFRDSPSQGDNNIRVHATKRLWIATFKTRTGMLSNVAPISGPETAESSRRNGRKPEGNPRRKPPPCSAQGLSPQPGIQRSRHPTRRGRPLGCR